MKNIAALIFKEAVLAQEARLPGAQLRNAQSGVLALALWCSWQHSFKSKYLIIGASVEDISVGIKIMLVHCIFIVLRVHFAHRIV